MSKKLKEILDRLSCEIEPGQFEKLRYEREEGALLKLSLNIAEAALKDTDFTAVNFDQFDIEGTGLILRHELSDQVVGNLNMAVDSKFLRFWFDPKQNFSSNHPGQPSSIPLDAANDDSIVAALIEQFGRIQFKGHP